MILLFFQAYAFPSQRVDGFVVRNALALYLLHTIGVEVKNRARLACSRVWARELRRSPAIGFATATYALTQREGPKHGRAGIQRCAIARAGEREGRP